MNKLRTIVSKVKRSALFRNKNRTILTSLVAVLVISAIRTCAVFSDHVGARLFLTIAAWKGEPVMQEWSVDAASDFHAYKDTITCVTFLQEFDEESDTFKARTSDVWDVSHAQDESVMAYMVNNDVYICANVATATDVIANPYSYNIFYNFESMTALKNAENLNTEHALTFDSMFFNCCQLSSLNIANWDTANVSDFSAMFSMHSATDYNWSITTLDLSGWDTGKAKYTDGMFHDMVAMETLKLGSKWSMKNVEDASSMFNECTALTGLDVSSWNTSSLKDASNMFEKCYAMTEIDISNWNMSKVTDTTRMLYSCIGIEELTVPDTLKTIHSQFAWGCPNLTTICFEHAENASLTFPSAGEKTGAFYVGNPYTTENPLPTNIGTENAKALAYDWESDHRARREPVLGFNWKFNSSDITSDIRTAIINTSTSVTVLNSFNENATMTAGPWDVSDAQDESVMAYMNGNNFYIASNVKYPAKVIANISSWNAFNGFDVATTMDVTNLDTSRVVAANYMMNGMPKLTEIIGLDTWDVSNIENMYWMFGGNSVIEDMSDINNWDVSTVFDFSHMFYHCDNLKTIDLSNWQIYNGDFTHHSPSSPDNPDAKSDGVVMDNMFSWCGELEYLGDITNWDVRNVTTFSMMFNRCDKLFSLEGSGKTTDLSNWADKVTNVKYMDQMFQHCYVLGNITGISDWQTDSLENCGGMFMECHALTEMDISGWNTTNLKSFGNMFSMSPVSVEGTIQKDDEGHPQLQSKLTKLDISGWTVRKTTNGAETYGAGMIGLTPLTELTLGAGWEYLPNYTFSEATKLVTVNFEHEADDTLEFGTKVFRLFETYGFDENNILLTTRNTTNKTIDGIQKAYDWIGDYRDCPPPILAEQDTWYSQGSPVDADGNSIYKSSITSIEMVDSYSTRGKTIVDQWDASIYSTGADDEGGPVTAYLENDGTGNGTYKLTIAGFGYGSILGNEDSNSFFDSFTSAKSINLSILDATNIKDAGWAFHNLSVLTDFEMGDWSKATPTNVAGMFRWCSSIEHLDVSEVNVTNCDSLEMFFCYCSNLKSITGLDQWNVSNITDFGNLFSSCALLEDLSDVYNWDLSSAEDFGYTFNSCSSLTELDLRNWITPNANYFGGMFERCLRLKYLNISNLDTTNIDDTYDLNSFAKHTPALTEIVLGPKFAADSSLHPPKSVTDSYNMFYATWTKGGAATTFSETNPLRTKVTGANAAMLAYDWANDHRGYAITVETVTGGSLTTNPSPAIAGATVTLTPSASEGYTYAGAVMTYTDAAGKEQIVDLGVNMSFIMPAGDVTITPRWQSALLVLALSVNDGELSAASLPN